MRIAFYAPMKPPGHPLPSGDRQMARHFLAALGQGGSAVDVISTFRSYDGKGDPKRQDRIRVLGRRLADRIAGRHERRPQREQPDAWFTYHLYHKAPDWLGPTVADRLSVPYVVAEASHAPKQLHGPWAGNCKAAAAAITRADLVIGLNPGDAACVRPLLANADCWLPLSPFIDTRPYDAARSDRARNRHALRSQYGLGGDEPVLLTVAMMRPGDKLHSYRHLADSLKHLLDRPWRLFVAGDGPARSEVLAALEPLGNRLIDLGRQGDDTLPGIYTGADLFVWPAVNEAFGVSLMEAQAAGVPVIAMANDGVAGIVENGRTGLLVARDDTRAFAGAVRELLDDGPRRRALATAAHRRAGRHHSIGAAAAVLAPALARLVSVGRADR
jgi:glycosyltransferase involved in cell wall biosynthesis